MRQAMIGVYAAWQCTNQVDVQLARKMGWLLVGAGYGVVFGGGATGPQGAVGQAALRARGRVISVTRPRWLEPADHDYEQFLTADTLPARTGEIELRASEEAIEALRGAL
jgi:predicted Rossmann-fold nucleotide-binding protein